MFHLRRTALKAVASASSASVARASRKISAPISSSSVFSQSKAFSTSFRTFEPEDNEKSTVQEAIDSAKETVSNAAAGVTEAAESVSERATSAWNSIAPQSKRLERGDRGGRDRGDRGGRSDRRIQQDAPSAEPSKNLYIGNIYFEVTEDTLKKEFEKFGTVTRAKIVYDGRGLSKGYGYIEFGDQEEAIKAQESLNGQVLEGRRLAVQYALKTAYQRPAQGENSSGPRNPPSKTLFIGNMSYEMSDKDLNDLFKEVKNVLDVRVAIDRRTGQPRGFAHADFLDTPSAEAAAKYLLNKEFYGRNLRVDYSGPSARPGNDRDSSA